MDSGEAVADASIKDLWDGPYFVHDCVFDFYGKRLATASSDGKIRIYERSEGEHGGFHEIGTEDGHRGAVLRLDWAAPDVGGMLCSCGVDNALCIWDPREIVTSSDSSLRVKLFLIVRLREFRSTVNDVKFAPRHLGAQLAAVTSGGEVHVYEQQAQDKTSVVWTQLHRFKALDDDDAVAKRATTCSWSPSRFDPTTLAIAGESDSVHLWTQSTTSRSWQRLARLQVAPRGATVLVHDVAWAPNMGRSFHMIAAAVARPGSGLPGFIRIWSFPISSMDTADRSRGGEAGADASVAASAAASASAATTGGAAMLRDVGATWVDLTGHTAEVWRLRWNPMGTVLSSTGDDGSVRLWRRSLSGEWRCVGVHAGPVGSTA